MSPSIEKLQNLWRNRSSILATDSPFVLRANKIYEIVERWEKAEAAITKFPTYPTPEEKQIPTNSWPKVKEELLKVYETSAELQPFRWQVEDVEALLLVQSRGADFRVASNASADSDYETFNTTPTPRNPESYYASYNYPFEIARFLFACKQSPDPAPFLRYCHKSKFAAKFLWLLANRERTVPIFSLACFHALSPLFRKMVDVDWGDRGHSWGMLLSEFATHWPKVSAQLSLAIAGQEYAGLTAGEKEDFARLLFIASLSDTTTKNALDMLKTGNQAIILYGPPGTGKTHQAQQVVKQLLEMGHSPEIDSHGEDNGSSSQLDACNFSKLFGDSRSDSGGSSDANPAGGHALTSSQPGCWELIQFHPTYSYHDFIGGIMPELTGGKLGYARKEGIFKRFCDAAKANHPKPFVLIIDEINRADLSSVFGELMYALEYRNRAVNILHFGAFEIPGNVYLIGTMNSADKSLVTFDLALRRRFLFFKLMPDMSVLHDWNANHRKDPPPIHADDIELLIERAKKLNQAIVGKGANELALPEDYGIGQAYFMKIRDFCVKEKAGATEDHCRRITEFAREQLWTYHLEPLLEEYLGAEAEAKRSELRKLRNDFVKGS